MNEAVTAELASPRSESGLLLKEPRHRRPTSARARLAALHGPSFHPHAKRKLSFCSLLQTGGSRFPALALPAMQGHTESDSGLRRFLLLLAA